MTQQDQLATSRANIALQMIKAYRALGGGWEPFAARECGPAANLADSKAKTARSGP